VSGERAIDEPSVRRVRIGSGANCSSIGSVIDTLFATAVTGAAIFAAVVAALKAEPIQVVRPGSNDDPVPPPRTGEPESPA
jgi:hypothetical protein